MRLGALRMFTLHPHSKVQSGRKPLGVSSKSREVKVSELRAFVVRAGCSTTFGASWSLRVKTCGPESALHKWASASLGNLMLQAWTRKVYGSTLAQLVWACPAPLTPRLFLLVTCGATLRLPSPINALLV